MLRLVWIVVFFFFSSRRRHTRFDCDWSSDVCSSDLGAALKSINTGLFADLASASAASASLFQSTNISLPSQVFNRSEERRVGKECRSRWSPDHEKKKRTEVKGR